MTRWRILVALLVLLLFVAQDVSAYVNFDDFQVNLLDHRLNVGDSLQVLLRFNNPDRTKAVEGDVEVLVNGVPLFRDEGYVIDFVEGEDKTVTITSNDFPGPDLGDNAYNQNLLKYGCGEYDVVVRVSGDDFKSDLEERDRYTLGGEDRKLGFEISPNSPSSSGDVVVIAYDDRKRELKDVSVKLTWIDDPNGNEMGKWDSEDLKLTKETNSRGEAKFNLSQKFTKNTCGLFQVDVYGDRYCLSRQTFDLNLQKMVIGVVGSVLVGHDARVCVNNSNGDGISRATVHVLGPEYSETYLTDRDGCFTFVPRVAGGYSVFANKTCYEPAEKSLRVPSDSSTAAGSENTVSTTTTVLGGLNGAATDAASTIDADENRPDGGSIFATGYKSFFSGISAFVSKNEGAAKLGLCVVLIVVILFLLKK